jgi:parvulin-like peptidyl-prolyl isomerase
MIRLAVVVMLATAACGPGSPGGPTMNSKMGGGNDLGPPPPSSVVSQDILAREPIANTAQAKHILIAWKDLEETYQGHMDPRAAKRSKADAETAVKQVLEQLKGGADFDAMMKQYSEDPGSASTGHPYKVTPDAGLVIEFRQLTLRLHVNEIGVCQSDYGFHIIKRVE